MKRTINESMLVDIEIILKTNIKVKINEFILVDAVRSTTMPSNFDKIWIKT